MKNNVLKRMGAYIIDLMLVVSISSVIFYCVSYIKPVAKYYESYNNYYKQAETYLKEFRDEKITQEEYNELKKDLTYKLDKYNVVATSILSATILGYFVIFAYYKNGITFGKKVCKLQIKSDNNKRVTMLQLFIRSIFLYGLLNNISKLALLCFTKDLVYYNAIYYVGMFLSLVEIAILLSIVMSKKGIGLHDMIAKTKVVTIDEKEENISEADYKEIKEEIDESSK